MAVTDTFAKPTPVKTAEVSIVSYIARFIGVVFMAAAVGLWIAPGANWSAELALLKLGLTCFFAIAGALSLTIRRR